MISFNSKLREEIKSHISNLDDNKTSQYNSKIKIKNNLRTKYLKFGYITDPKKDIHMEYDLTSVKEANETLEELMKCGISGKLSFRGKKFIVYIKDEKSVLHLLQVLGALNTKSDFESIVKEKTQTLDVSRKINFEMANIKRATQAAINQIEDINIVLKHYDKNEIDTKIYQLMEMRLKNPSASFNELIELMGNVSKSNLNYRFRIIKNMAEKYK